MTSEVRRLLCVFFISLLTACGGGESSTATPAPTQPPPLTNTPAPIATSLPTDTPVPTDTPMTLPTATPAPTQPPELTNTRTSVATYLPTYPPAPTDTPVTPTDTPTLTPIPTPLSESGPWGLIEAEDGIWAINPDGSGLIRLSSDIVHWDAISAGGKYVAYATDLQVEGDPDRLRGVVLKILELPKGTAHTVIEIQVPDRDELLYDELYHANFDVLRAISEGGLAWSPDGSKLAFASGHSGTSADLYVYALHTGVITRLTDGPADACQFEWSRDGQYIFHVGMSVFSTGAGHRVDKVWVARADGSGNQLLYEAEPSSGGEYLVAWVSTDTVLVYSWRIDCGEVNLRLIDVPSGETQVVWPDYFHRVTRNPSNGTILLDASDVECNPREAVGYFVIEPDNLVPRQISKQEYESMLPDTGFSDAWSDWYESWSPDGQAVYTVSKGLIHVARAPDFVTEILSQAVKPLWTGPIVVWAIP
jgi:hypothetical protein